MIFTYEDKTNVLKDEFKHPEAGDYNTHKRFGESPQKMTIGIRPPEKEKVTHGPGKYDVDE